MRWVIIVPVERKPTFCHEAPGWQRSQLTVVPTLTPRRRGREDTSPWVSSKDLSTSRSLKRICNPDGPQWLCSLTAPVTPASARLPGWGWDFQLPSSTTLQHSKGHGQVGRRASPSASTARPHGRRTKRRKKLLPLIPSLVSHMPHLLKNAI